VILRHKLENPPPPWFWGWTKKPTADFEAKSRETVTTRFEAKLEKTVTAGFESKPSETVAAGFEAKSAETIATGFEAKPLKTVATGFETKPLETVAAGFEAKPLETVITGFEVKLVKTVWVVLRPNHSQTVAIGFEAQTDVKPFEWFWGQTTHKSSTLVLRLNQETCALVSMCTVQTVHGVTRPLDHRATEYLTCATIPSPLHQVSYSYHNPHHCTPCCTCHLHTTRQANMILQTKQRQKKNKTKLS
jgi:hypothetical protein